MNVGLRSIGVALMLGAWLFGLSGCSTVNSKRKGAFYPKTMSIPTGTQRMDNVRVALFQNLPRVRMSTTGGTVKIHDMNTRSVMAEVSLKDDAQLTARDQHFVLNGQTLLAQKIRFVPAENEFLKCNGLRYRGQIEVTCNARNGILVVNILPLEDYLKGVVPNEVQHTWSMEALKAQAVAARTFVLTRMAGSGNNAYDVEAGTNSQVYKGLDSERESTNVAVAATTRMVATNQGKFISAFYHSNCGGHTADVRNVWGNDIAYLKGVTCGFCNNSPHATWSLTLSISELPHMLGQRNIKQLRTIDVMGRLPDGRVMSLEIVHESGKEIMKAPAFRMLIGPERLKSTAFEIQPEGKNIVFKGRGWGHGVGLCQEGAAGMAKAGYGFSDILEYYYPGIDIRLLD